MEVCGGQTHAIVKFGIDRLLPPEISLVHGPGCPVCVTPVEYIDKAIEIAYRPEVILCSFGDMLRVPGSERRSSCRANRAAAMSVLSIPRSMRSRSRAPSRTARWFSSRWASRPRHRRTPWRSIAPSREGIRNFSMLASHVLVPPAMRAILDPPPTNRVQGFLAAGHVCTIMGVRGIRADRGAPTACRSSSLASSRSISLKACICASVSSSGPRRDREPVQPIGQAGGKSAGPGDHRARCFKSCAAPLARHRRDRGERPRRCPTPTAIRCREGFGVGGD